MNDDYSDLVKALEDVKARQKALAESEADLKEQLLEIMTMENINKLETNYGSVRIQKRTEKIYGPEVLKMEKELKEAKKLADDMGDYTNGTVKSSLVFTPPGSLI